MSGVHRGAVALMTVALVGSACGATSPTGTVAATTVPATPTATASATARPTPVVSSKGTITVEQPQSGERVNGAVVVAGEASVFEANVLYRVITASGKVLAEGFTTASAGAPQKGTFRVEVKFEPPSNSENGFVEVFERSPRDNTVSDIARVPVSIQGSY